MLKDVILGLSIPFLGTSLGAACVLFMKSTKMNEMVERLLTAFAAGVMVAASIWSLILPAITVGTGLMATMTRTTRSSMLDVIRQDYLRTARSKGVPEKKVINVHALRNALIPIITVVGTEMGKALGGAVVTENVFSWPGVGRLIIDGVSQRDTTLVTGCIILTSILVSIVQLVVDILYAFVDPRLRAQYTGSGKKKAKTDVQKGGAAA